MKHIQKMFYRNVDDAFQGAIGDEDLVFNDDGELVFPDEEAEGPTEEELAAQAQQADEEKQARIAAKAIELADEARAAKTHVKETPKVEVPAGDPDQDIIDRLRGATDPAEVFLIQREGMQRQINRNQSHLTVSESLRDQIAREFAGDDSEDQKFVKTRLATLNEAQLKYVASNPQERENLELIVEGRRAKRSREAPATPPRSERGREAPSVAFSNSDNSEIDKMSKGMGIPRKDAEIMYRASLRG